MNHPPRILLRFFRWFCRRDLAVYIEGDLLELYRARIATKGKPIADLLFACDVILLFRPSMMQDFGGIQRLNSYGMIKSYVRIGWRSLLRSKGYSAVNIGGLAVGLAVVILISLWIHDEWSFNRGYANYERVSRVWVNHTFNGAIDSQWSLPFPLGDALRQDYDDFEFVSMATWSYGHFINWKKDRYSKEGMFVQSDFLRLLGLKMKAGNLDALREPHAIVLAESLATTIFGDEDPIGEEIQIDMDHTAVVTGVFEDAPSNSTFATTLWLANIELYLNDYVRQPNARAQWQDFSYQAFVTLRDGRSVEEINDKIREVIVRHEPRAAESNATPFLQPMSRWHLYSDYRDGVNVGGEITFVWLFGAIGSFVLILACINFVNLATARAQGRAKEIGLRKTVGSYRAQLVTQFLIESILVVTLAFVISLVIATACLGTFNEWTGKQIAMPIDRVEFWIAGLIFIIATGVLAGVYPALLLSSFNTVSILNGTFRLGGASVMSRKTLVVFQFMISVTLVIGSLTVYRQVEFARSRPIGYDKSDLITTYGYPFRDWSLHPNTYDGLREGLLASGAVVEMGKSSSPTTAVYAMQSDFDWEGRDRAFIPNIAVVGCTHDYGKTIGIQVVSGRDFSRAYASDTAALVINRAAADYMSLAEPVGKTVYFNRVPFQVIGVIENMLMESPYAAAGPLVMMIDYQQANIITMKLNRSKSPIENIDRIEQVFKNFRPNATFEVQFVSDQFDQKFRNEERIGRIAGAFTCFAILISCLGLIGMASFVAEQRTREICIRKVSGATVGHIWGLLTKDFVWLVVGACALALPIGWQLTHVWLSQYQYQVPTSLGLFIGVSVGAVLLTLATVSYQALRAAHANPAEKLRALN